MSVRDVEQLDERGMTAWDKHNTDEFADLFADGFVYRDSSLPEPLHSKDAIKQYMQGWYTAFPDMHVRQTNRVANEDAVSAEIEFIGTNSGPLMMGGQQLPPTGRSVVGHGAYFAKVRDGKIVEFSAHPDVAEMMMQLGMMPQG
jgi:steroid delta-isomerase-like uncharacterized protein